ncbi:MAG: carboxypeptidase-like regulatory domain-containing protein [Bacteroidia bacterium]|nr:carboxypeptidase-like regulatory domain-containing protein [Bacteroidia bacterium]
MAKEVAKKLVVSTALEIALTIKVYATDSNNLILKDDFTLTQSDLDQLRDTELIIEAQRIHAAAAAMAVDLAPYGITPVMVSAFLTAITGFVSILATPRIKVSQKFIARESIDVLLFQATNILDSIDALMLRYKYSNTVFYKEYRKARKIINLGHRNTRLGLFVELEDGVDYAGFSVLLQKGISSYMGETDSDGKALFESLKAGKYAVTITKDGYETYNGVLTVKSGVLNTIKVSLNLI